MKKSIFALLAASSTFILTGCDSLRNTFGLDHYQADEFNVAENPPLSMPPNYTLTPPSYDANSKDKNKEQKKQKDDSSSMKAKEALLGKKSKTEDTESASAKAIVAKASADTKADPKIRETVEKEEAAESSSMDGVSEKLSKMGQKIVENAKKTSNNPAVTQAVITQTTATQVTTTQNK